MKKRTPISKIMASDIKTVNKTQTLKDVSHILDDASIRHIPVVSGDKVIGMLSKTDLERISFVNAYDGEGVSTTMYDALSIDQVMTKNPTTVQATDTIYDVAVLLSKSEFHALPVEENEKLVGIVTTTDLIKYLVDQF